MIAWRRWPWGRDREAMRKRMAAVAEGKVTVEVIVYDGAGKRWGGTASATPEELSRLMPEFARSVVDFAVNDKEAQERLGWTPPPPVPEGKDPVP